MANRPFDRTLINVRERPLSSDINRLESTAYAEWQEFLLRYGQRRSSTTTMPGDGVQGPGVSGFIGGGFKVRPTTPAMEVSVSFGMGVQDDPTNLPVDISGILGVNDNQRTKILELLTAYTFAVPAAGVADRIDIVEIKYQDTISDIQSRDILDPGTGIFAAGNVNKVISPVLDGLVGTGTGAPTAGTGLYYKVGTPGGGVPATDAGYISIAQVLVPLGTVSIDTDRIIDLRNLLLPGGQLVVSGSVQIDKPAANCIAKVVGLSAPPGVVFGVYGDGAGGDLTKAVFFLQAGLTAFRGKAMIVIQPRADGGTFAAAASNVGITSVAFNMDLTQQANLQDATKVAATSVVKIAVGQPVVSCAAFGLPNATGILTQFDFTITLQF